MLYLTAYSQNSYKKGWNIIDKKGNILVHLENNYETIGVFQDGYAFVSINGKEGFINQKGEKAPLDKVNELINKQGRINVGVSTKEPFFNYYPIKRPNGWYFNSKDGHESSTNYQLTSVFFSEGLAAVKINNKWGFANEDNKLVIKPIYDIKNNVLEYFYLGDIFQYMEQGFITFSEGLCPVFQNDSLHYINTKGEKMFSFPPQTYGYGFSENRAVIERYVIGNNSNRGNKQYLIDNQGKIIKELPNYSFIGNFSDGLAHVIRDGDDWGFIDKTGKEVIPLSLPYSQVSDFSNGLCKVELNGKYGYIDRTGKEVISPLFDECSDFSNDEIVAVKLK